MRRKSLFTQGKESGTRLIITFYQLYVLNVRTSFLMGHGVKVGLGLQNLGSRDSGTRDPPQSLKVGPGTSLKFKRGMPRPPSKFKSGTPGPSSKFKSGTLIIIFLHCLTYFVLDKYIYNMEIIFHE